MNKLFFIVGIMFALSMNMIAMNTHRMIAMPGKEELNKRLFDYVGDNKKCIVNCLANKKMTQANFESLVIKHLDEYISKQLLLIPSDCSDSKRSDLLNQKIIEMEPLRGWLFRKLLPGIEFKNIRHYFDSNHRKEFYVGNVCLSSVDVYNARCKKRILSNT